MRDTETSGPVLPDNKRLAYRVSYIPEDFNINEATIFLKQCLAAMDLDVESLVMDSNGRHAQTATVTLKTLSEKLQGDTDEWEIRSFASKSTYSHIVVDKHFYGFTPLYAPNEEEHTVDCIAISGLGGHAFGSWKARNSSYMWLRDALPRDLPKARVLIYGYESSVSKSKSFQNLGDIASSFRASLREVRSSRRPVIFIAHSLGGLVLKQALVQMAASGDEDDACHLKATSDVLFFGVPNQGMELNSLYPMAHGQLNLAFLSTLDKNSIYLQSLMTEFNKLDLSNTRIMSFYETSTSPTARLVSSGKWSMSDEHAMLVDRYSATSGRSWNNTFPINRNHSDMIKYTRRDTVYDTVCRYLKESARRAPAAIYQKPNYLVASTFPSALVKSPEDFSAKVESLRPTRSLPNLPKTNDMTTLPFREYKLSKSIESSNISSEAVTDGARPSSNLPKSSDETTSPFRTGELFTLVDNPNVSLEAVINRTDARTHNVADLQEQQRALQVLSAAGFDVKATYCSPAGALLWAVQNGNNAVVQWLLQGGKEHGFDVISFFQLVLDRQRLLHIAASKNFRVIARLLLDRGANINTKDKDGRTSLHCAVEHKQEAMVRLLLEKGADTNAKTGDAMTALHYASRYEQVAVVRLLLEKGADINAKTRNGTTPLHLVALTGCKSIAKILLESGSDLHAVNSAGVTALHSAADVGNKSIVQLLLEKGANPNARNDHGETSLDLARIGRKKNFIELLEPITEKTLNINPWGFGGNGVQHDKR